MKLTVTETVRAPIDTTFTVFSDVANCADRISGRQTCANGGRANVDSQRHRHQRGI